jgi:hypothetical protein
MKLTLTQEEIKEILNDHIVTKLNKSINRNTVSFKVTWDQEYDCQPEDIEYTVELLVPRSEM